MNDEANIYWRTLEERRGDPEALARRREEFLDGPPGRQHIEQASTSRRDFLSLVGFSLAALTAAGCTRGQIHKAIPLLNQPAELTPGVPSWYATTCAGCSASCSLIVKTRDGRPIKVEGNSESALFGGGTCAVGQATVLSLYDEERLKEPLWQGKAVSWEEIDAHITDRLAAAVEGKKNIVLLSGTITSPSTRELIAEWSRQYAGFRHVVYDPISSSALREATRASFGKSHIPHYRFDRAQLIVAIEADFLGTWLSPVEFTRQYASRRKVKPGSSMSRHIQFESGLSLTGSNADMRFLIAPSEQGLTALGLLLRIAARTGTADLPALPDPSWHTHELDVAAEELWQQRGESVVVCGAQDVSIQIIVHAINVLLGNIGKTIDLDCPSLQKEGDDRAMARLLKEMSRGEVDVLVLYGVNPAYDHPDAERFKKSLEGVPLTVSFASYLDETSSLTHAVCPTHHFLEAWNDAEPVASFYSLAQPTIAPLFNTRSAQESLLTWMGKTPDFYAYLRDYWRRNLFPRQDRYATFDDFWDHSLRDGICDLPVHAAHESRLLADWRESARMVLDEYARIAAEGPDRYEVQLHETVALRDGTHANNPWLQELPDPITKVTWGNYAAIAPALASRLRVSNGDVVRITHGPRQLDVPVYVQPGQSPRTISVALGFGRTRVGKVGRGVGVNTYPLATLVDDTRRYFVTNARLERTGGHEPLAATQTHHSMEGRPIVKETTLAACQQNRFAAHADRRELPSLVPDRPAGEHAWGMAIDLNACTGCSACIVACQAENNIPVVGKDEVQRGREMHWIRVDRYYTGSEDNPDTVVQPMMCQHCGNAPCEPVCPVLATVHSSDGLNQQVYNRCVGTRYCANNCPYKVRRFNWFAYAGSDRFDYHMNSAMGRLVLNPDVVVRSRGVMEKCSLCVQRIQAGKLLARQEGRSLQDGDIKTACQQVCPAQAIVFGDLQDPDSQVSRLSRDPRHYHVLEELGTRPNVGYLAKVRNRSEG